jgi:hypothetical protein
MNTFIVGWVRWPGASSGVDRNRSGRAFFEIFGKLIDQGSQKERDGLRLGRRHVRLTAAEKSEAIRLASRAVRGTMSHLGGPVDGLQFDGI